MEPLGADSADAGVCAKPSSHWPLDRVARFASSRRNGYDATCVHMPFSCSAQGTDQNMDPRGEQGGARPMRFGPALTVSRAGSPSATHGSGQNQYRRKRVSARGQPRSRPDERRKPSDHQFDTFQSCRPATWRAVLLVAGSRRAGQRDPATNETPSLCWSQRRLNRPRIRRDP